MSPSLPRCHWQPSASCLEGPACRLLQGNAPWWGPHPTGLAGSSGVLTGCRPDRPGPWRDKATRCEQGSERWWDSPPSISGHFCRMHLETTCRAIRKVVWGLTASLTAGLWPVSAWPAWGISPGWGQETQGPWYSCLHPQHLGSGQRRTFPLGPSPQAAMVLISKCFQPTASSVPANRAERGRSREAGARAALESSPLRGGLCF